MVLLAILLMAGALIAGAFALRRLWGGKMNAPERSWLTRMLLFAIGGAVLMGALLLPLPAKHRLLALVPAFFLSAVFVRVFKSGRARLGRQVRGRTEPDIEKIRRLN